VDLPTGMEFAFTATSSVPGYLGGQVDVGPIAAPLTQDFPLTADAVSCSAPGYSAPTLLSEDFESGALPAGWTATSNGEGWLFGSNLGSDYFEIPAHTIY